MLHRDPGRMRMWKAICWVLSVCTNVALIVASSLGYFFFAGLRVFAVLFVKGQYGVGEGVATLLLLMVGAAALIGTLAGGRITDWLIRRGRLKARLTVGAAGFITAALLLIPSLLTTSLAIALPLFLIAGAALSSPNPPVDAARLDVVLSRMWGRAEAIRTFVRSLLEAFAPLMFGLVSQLLGGGPSAGFGTGVNTKYAHLSAAATRGLDHTFLIMLVPLAASGVILLLGRRAYASDVASAAASDEETRKASP